MTIKFDGKGVAKTKFTDLKKTVDKIVKSGVVPCIVSVVVGDSEGALGYQKLKQKKGREIGIELQIKSFGKKMKLYQILEAIQELNTNSEVHGIMVQLPLPPKFTDEDRYEIIHAIDPFKDVDGMRDESPYIAPVVLAVEYALETALKEKPCSRVSPSRTPSRIETLVIGSRGFVGNKTFTYLKSKGYKVRGVDIGDYSLEKKFRHSGVVISCVGRPHMVTRQMVLPNQILIDVGAPVGDVDTDCYDEVAFVTPVPGGIGPVTIYFLMENLVKAAKN